MGESTTVLGLFPGQGAQSVGMGLDMYQESSLARDVFALADEALGFSLSEICFEGPIEELTRTEIAQPAILLCSYLSFKLRPLESVSQVDVGIGHSLGEYSALVAAGSIDLSEALRLVNRRGKYMQEAVPKGEGRMIAVLGTPIEQIEAACGQVEIGVAEIANINAPGQVVVSGDLEGIERLMELLAGAKIRELKVSAPFHCSLMKPAADRLAADLADTPIKSPSFPVYSNCWARPVETPDEIRQALIEQVCSRVRFVECLAGAVERYQVSVGCEFGPGKVLSGLVKRAGHDIELLQV